METASSCRLLGGSLGYSCQAVLAALAFSSLAIQRARERHPLDLRVWGLNVGKQVVALLAAHIFAIVASVLLSARFHGASECSWYLAIFTVDTVVGTALTVVLHKCVLRASESFLQKKGQPSLLRSVCEATATCGYYGSPPSTVVWAVQAIEWTVCVLLARMVCAVLVAVLGSSLLAGFAVGVDGMFAGHANLQLGAVMIVWPLLVNSAQALFQDAILRGKRFHGGHAMPGGVEMNALRA